MKSSWSETLHTNYLGCFSQSTNIAGLEQLATRTTAKQLVRKYISSLISAYDLKPYIYREYLFPPLQNSVCNEFSRIKICPILYFWWHICLAWNNRVFHRQHKSAEQVTFSVTDNFVSKFS
jgi:hypothetical protein